MAGSIIAVRALIDTVEQAGISREALLHAAGFDPKRPYQSDSRVEPEELDALIEAALMLTADESLGLRMGRLAGVTTLNLAAHLVVHASTLREGLGSLTRFHRLLTDRLFWQLHEHGQTATLVFQVAPGSAACRRFRAEVVTSAFCRILRHFERGARPQTVAFEFGAPACGDEYARAFGGTERFDETFTGIVFERSLLDAVQLHQDPEFHAALCAQAEKRVVRLTHTIRYTERVREYALSCAPRDRRNMEAVAHGLGLSARSLRRRLGEEGASYADVIAGVLATLAKRLISEEAHSIEATAYAMGYSDPTAFHRAFKRWTGSTPAAYRSRPENGLA
jgi:AraC-like DNA-binding protein